MFQQCARARTAAADERQNCRAIPQGAPPTAAWEGDPLQRSRTWSRVSAASAHARRSRLHLGQGRSTVHTWLVDKGRSFPNEADSKGQATLLYRRYIVDAPPITTPSRPIGGRSPQEAPRISVGRNQDQKSLFFLALASTWRGVNLIMPFTYDRERSVGRTYYPRWIAHATFLSGHLKTEIRTSQSGTKRFWWRPTQPRPEKMVSTKPHCTHKITKTIMRTTCVCIHRR